MKKVTKVLSLTALIGGVVVGTTSCSSAKVKNVEGVSKVLAKSIDATYEKLENFTEQKGFSVSLTEKETYKEECKKAGELVDALDVNSEAKVQASVNFEAFRSLRDAAKANKEQPKAADVAQFYAKASADVKNVEKDDTYTAKYVVEAGYQKGLFAANIDLKEGEDQLFAFNGGVKLDLNNLVYAAQSKKVIYKALLDGLDIDELFSFDKTVEEYAKEDAVKETIEEYKPYVDWVAGNKTTAEFIEYLDEEFGTEMTADEKALKVTKFDLIKDLLDSFVDISGTETSIKFKVSDETIKAGIAAAETKIKAASDDVKKDFFDLEDVSEFDEALDAMKEHYLELIPDFSAAVTVKFDKNVISGIKGEYELNQVEEDEEDVVTTKVTATENLSFKFATSKVTAVSTKAYDKNNVIDANGLASGDTKEIAKAIAEIQGLFPKVEVK